MYSFFDPDRRSYIAASVIYGLLCQAVFAPLVTAVLLFAAGPAQAASPGLRTIVICSGIGLARVTVDETGKPIDPPNRQAQQTCLHCPAHTACLVPPGSTATALAVPAVSAPPPAPPRHVDAAVGGLRQGSNPVRGPPLLRP